MVKYMNLTWDEKEFAAMQKDKASLDVDSWEAYFRYLRNKQ